MSIRGNPIRRRPSSISRRLVLYRYVPSCTVTRDSRVRTGCYNHFHETSVKIMKVKRIKDYILPEDSHSMEMSVMVSTSVMPSKELHPSNALTLTGRAPSLVLKGTCGSIPVESSGETLLDTICSDQSESLIVSSPQPFISKNQNAGYAAGYFLCLTMHHRNISTVAPSSIHHGGSADLRSFHTHLSFGPSSVSLSYGDINDETARTETSKVLCCPCRG